MTLEVLPVEGKDLLAEFIALPFVLYRRDPLWVPPLKSEVADLFLGRHPFCRHADIRAFLARKGGKAVGRVAAIYDRNFVAYHGRETGYFGYFEAVDDPEVVSALFEAAEGFLREKGVTEVIGPMNPSTNYECGLLIDGFSTPPYILMPHNPPYYLRLLESVGFEKAKDLYANILIGDGKTPERLQRIAERARKRLPMVTIREANMKRLPEEIAKFVEIYHEAWANNWGFVPMSEEEVAYMAKQLRALIVPSLALFAEVEGEPAGFILALPNYNRVLKALGGRLTPWGILKALWAKRKIKELRIPLFGVRPKFRLRGVDTLLYTEVFSRGWEMGYKEAELSWILEDNHLMQKAIEAMGGRPYKIYRIFRKAIG